MSITASPPSSRESLATAIGRIASGVYVITLDRGGERDGMLTSWIAQAGFEPPMLSLAVKKDRPILSKLGDGQTFVVNVLAKNNMDIYKNFVKPHTADLNRFEGLSILSDRQGDPIFSDAVAYMSCVVRGSIAASDHVVIIAEIVGGAGLKIDQEPIVHLRKNGFQY